MNARDDTNVSEFAQKIQNSVESGGDAASRQHLRDYLARLLLNNLPKLRQAARRKLSSTAQSVHDSPDIASSVIRRMDELAHEGRLDAMADEELIRFALTIARHQAVSRTRTMERFAMLRSEDGHYAELIHDRLGRCRDDDDATMLCYRIAIGIDDAESRQLFLLRWKGLSSAMIGQLLGISSDAVRQRWMLLRRALAERLAKGEFDARL